MIRDPLAKGVERGMETTLQVCGESNPCADFFWVPFFPYHFGFFIDLIK